MIKLDLPDYYFVWDENSWWLVNANGWKVGRKHDSYDSLLAAYARLVNSIQASTKENHYRMVQDNIAAALSA